MEQVNRTKYIIASVALVFILVVIYFLFIFHKGPKEIKKQETTGEVQQIESIDIAKHPYVTLTPTSDGAEIIISIENMLAFDRIEYELTYLADNPQAAGEKITRGSTGTDVNTKEAKYKKSILLGTASRGVRSPDKGIADGKLSLHLFKGEAEYLSESPWNLLEVGTKSQTLEDSEKKFKLEIPSLGKNYWVILADTIGVPPEPEGFEPKNVILPIYGAFSVAPEFTKAADLSITFSQNTQNADLYTYNHTDSKWQKAESSYNTSAKTLTAKVNSFATFVVVSSK